METVEEFFYETKLTQMILIALMVLGTLGAPCIAGFMNQVNNRSLTMAEIHRRGGNNGPDECEGAIVAIYGIVMLILYIWAFFKGIGGISLTLFEFQNTVVYSKWRINELYSLQACIVNNSQY